MAGVPHFLEVLVVVVAAGVRNFLPLALEDLEAVEVAFLVSEVHLQEKEGPYLEVVVEEEVCSSLLLEEEEVEEEGQSRPFPVEEEVEAEAHQNQEEEVGERITACTRTPLAFDASPQVLPIPLRFSRELPIHASCPP